MRVSRHAIIIPLIILLCGYANALAPKLKSSPGTTLNGEFGKELPALKINDLAAIEDLGQAALSHDNRLIDCEKAPPYIPRSDSCVAWWWRDHSKDTVYAFGPRPIALSRPLVITDRGIGRRPVSRNPLSLGDAYPADAAIAKRISKITPKQLLEITTIQTLAATSGGDYVAFTVAKQDVKCNCYRQKWFVLEISSRQVIEVDHSRESALLTLNDARVTSGVVFATPVWNPMETGFLYLKKGHGTHKLFVYSVPSRKRNEIDTRGDNVFEATWSKDGTSILYVTGEPSKEAQKWYENGLSKGFLYDDSFIPFYQHKPMFPKIPGWEVVETSYPVEKRYRKISLKTGAITDASRDEIEYFNTASISSVVYASEHPKEHVKSSNGAYIASRKNDFQTYSSRTQGIGIAFQAANSETVLPCEACEGFLIDVFWSDILGGYIFSRPEIGDPTRKNFTFYDIKKKEARPLFVGLSYQKSVGAGFCGTTQLVRGQLVCIWEEPNTPAKLVSVNIKTGNRAVLFDPNRKIRGLISNRVERVRGTSKSGGMIFGYLVYPSNYDSNSRYPLVVVTYTVDGFLKGGTGDEYPIFNIADSGMLVFTTTLPRYEDKDVEFRWANTFHDFEEILENQIRKWVECGLIDDERIAYTGLSTGASFVAFSMARGRAVTAAIISTATGYDTTEFFLAGQVKQEGFLKQRNRLNPNVARALQRSGNFFLENSVALRADEIETPLLINAPESDYLNLLELVTTLSDFSVPAEMYVYLDEYHVKVKPSHRLAIYHRNIDWLQFWLQGYEDPNPEKAKQYARWRAMRDEQCAQLNGEKHMPWYCRRR